MFVEDLALLILVPQGLLARVQLLRHALRQRHELDEQEVEARDGDFRVQGVVVRERWEYAPGRGERFGHLVVLVVARRRCLKVGSCVDRVLRLRSLRYAVGVFPRGQSMAARLSDL